MMQQTHMQCLLQYMLQCATCTAACGATCVAVCVAVWSCIRLCVSLHCNSATQCNALQRSATTEVAREEYDVLQCVEALWMYLVWGGFG